MQQDFFLDDFKINCGERALSCYQDQETLKQNYKYELGKIFERVESERLAEDFYSWQNLANTRASHYKNRLYELEEDKALVAGIRFKGGDKNRPFVGIFCRNFKLDKSLQQKLSTLFAKEFSVFKPATFRCYIPEEQKLEELSYQTDLHLIAAPVRKLDFNHELPEGYKVEKASRLDFYEEFKKQYDRFIESNQIGNELYPATQSGLEECHRDGTLSVLLKEDEVQGVFATSRESLEGLSGISVFEEFLFEKSRGQGLAKVLQARSIKMLNYPKDEILMGTIHCENLASVRTAQNLGRKIIGTYHFFNSL